MLITMTSIKNNVFFELFIIYDYFFILYNYTNKLIPVTIDLTENFHLLPIHKCNQYRIIISNILLY